MEAKFNDPLCGNNVITKTKLHVTENIKAEARLTVKSKMG
jgi:hypothetical protein